MSSRQLVSQQEAVLHSHTRVHCMLHHYVIIFSILHASPSSPTARIILMHVSSAGVSPHAAWSACAAASPSPISLHERCAGVLPPLPLHRSVDSAPLNRNVPRGGLDQLGRCLARGLAQHDGARARGGRLIVRRVHHVLVQAQLTPLLAKLVAPLLVQQPRLGEMLHPEWTARLVEEQAGEEDGEVRERGEEEAAGVRLSTRMVALEAPGGEEEQPVKAQRLDGEHARADTRRPARRRQQRQIQGVLQAERRRALPRGVGERYHLVASLRVVGAVHPRQREEVGDLPEEEGAEERRGLRREQRAARRRPPHHRRDRAHHRAHPGVPRAERFHRSVQQRVHPQRAEPKRGGEGVGPDEQRAHPRRAGGRRPCRRVLRRDPAGGERTARGAIHRRVARALEELVEGVGGGGAEEGAAERRGGDVRVGRRGAHRVSRGGSHDDESTQATL
mmetsp:Transcript_22589/g.47856  ORF Transcript_22589/g.47856 Transcript_22589/m.47856 type:complete len:447 (+) Transcript_22589:244-1584(+)